MHGRRVASSGEAGGHPDWLVVACLTSLQYDICIHIIICPVSQARPPCPVPHVPSLVSEDILLLAAALCLFKTFSFCLPTIWNRNVLKNIFMLSIAMDC